MEDNVTQTPETEQSVADILKDYKENYVSKEKYDQLYKEHTDVVKKILNGESVEVNTTKEVSTDELRKKLFEKEGFQGSDIEFWETTLALRDKVQEEEGYDIFVPHGRKASPQPQDYMNAEIVATNMREILDYANGDNKLFMSELQKRMKGR